MWLTGAKTSIAIGWILFYWYFYAPSQACYHPHEGLNTCGYGDISLPPEPPILNCDFSDVGCP